MLLLWVSIISTLFLLADAFVDLIFCRICLIWPLDVNVEGKKCFLTFAAVKDDQEKKFPLEMAVIQEDLTGLKSNW